MAAEFVVKLDIEISDDQRAEFEQAICKAVMTKIVELDFSEDVTISRNLSDIGNGGPIGFRARVADSQ